MTPNISKKGTSCLKQRASDASDYVTTTNTFNIIHKSRTTAQQPISKTAGPSAEKKPIGTFEINQEQASNRKNGTKFNIIKTVKSLKKAQEPGSEIHYESMLQKRQSGLHVIRRRNEGYDSPFDDEKDDVEVDNEKKWDLDGMSISNFSKRYENYSTPFN